MGGRLAVVAVVVVVAAAVAAVAHHYYKEKNQLSCRIPFDLHGLLQVDLRTEIADADESADDAVDAAGSCILARSLVAGSEKQM